MSRNVEVILCLGLPGCGKSTWAKKLVEDGLGKWKRVNKDDLRAMIDNSHWSKHNEDFVLQVRNFVVLEAVKKGYCVVIDDTNFGKHFDNIKALVAGYATVRIEDFTDVPLAICIERDLKRLNSVGKDVIMGMYNRYLNPNKDKVNDLVPSPINPKLPNCVICDLDGTISLLNGRNPYDASTCENDIPNEAVIRVINGLRATHANMHILFTSGRKDTYKEQTINFLKANGFEPNGKDIHLHMRKHDDNRKDCEVKQEMFFNHISGRYNVLVVLDDRNQVVDGWRSLGLVAFQVAPGDF